ncbi:hypothetical protein [Clostridium sp. E02]|uniref:hypothetical protein n=1 Tax=Clostridium sp. E02 TaxID=2487134 RepID=UPI000F523594|nr:hypothetical protein [Clostridium sp. E02]
MTKKVMAVYDEDPLYTERFAEYVTLKKLVPFSVMAFIDFNELVTYGMNHEIELLLLSSSISWEQIQKIGAGKVVLLSDGTVPIQTPCKAVYKYQNTDGILREIMAEYRIDREETGYLLAEKKGKIMGVYSPINRCLKTSFSLAAGQILSRDKKVLYLNLEDYSGFGRLIGETYKGGLSDLLYDYSQEGFDFRRLGSVVYTWGELDYVPPVRYPEDLLMVTAKDMADLISHLSRESIYQIILMDLGQYGKKAAELLEVCDHVYMPVKDDFVSMAKVDEFEDYLTTSGHQSLKDRIQKIKLPYHCTFGRKESYLEQLLWSELGDCTRQIIRNQL